MNNPYVKTNITKGNWNLLLNEFSKNNQQVNDLQGNVDSLVSSMADKTYQKTCKELKLVANDSSDSVATNNFSLLVTALNNGYKILVDDKYFILPSTTGTQITSGAITIEGGTSNAEFAIPPSKTGIYKGFELVSGFVKISKVKITGTITSGGFYFFTVTDAKTLTSFDVSQCNLNNRMRMLVWSFTNSSTFFDPSTYGITYLNFTNNQCYNVATDNYGMFLLSDVPITLSILRDNIIKNFANTFYYNAITNTNTYASALSQRMERLIVERNKVTCDDTWNTPSSPLPISMGAYHCFVLFEGQQVEYRQNHVEGIHTFDPNHTIYDAYLSAWRVIFENNTWKNNICFSATKQYATLMKSKSYTKDSYVGTSRIYRNNTYIVEKTYADKFSRAYDELAVELSGYQSEIDSVIVENNVVDVYKLRLSYNQAIYEYFFSNNKIHAYKTDNTYNTLVPYAPLTNPSLARGCTVRKNHVLIDVAEFFGQDSLIVSSGVSNMAVVRNDTIIMEDNHIEWANLFGLMRSTSSSINILPKVIKSNNYIKSTQCGTVSGKMMYNAYNIIVRDLTTINNLIEIPVNGYYSQVSLRGGQQQLELSHKLKSYFRGDIRNMCLVADSNANQELLSKAYYNRVTVKCTHSTGTEDFTFDYKHYNNAGVNTIDFTNSSSVAVTQALDGSGTNTNTNVKLNGTSSELTVAFMNDATNMGFQLKTTIPTDELVVLEIKQTQSVKG